MALDGLDSRTIAERLSGEVGQTYELPGISKAPRPSAVLLPLFRQAEAWHLLFIRRAENERDSHSGEVAYPGGRCEDCDTDVIATALRESEEEVGLPPNQVEVLGELDSYQTVSNHLVSPVVGQIPWPLELQHNPTEVARIFSIPLAWLAQPANHQIKLWPEEQHPQARPVVFFKPYDNELLWGVSARITLDLIKRLNGGATGT